MVHNAMSDLHLFTMQMDLTYKTVYMRQTARNLVQLAKSLFAQESMQNTTSSVGKQTPDRSATRKDK
jgi:hypothetical protein